MTNHLVTVVLAVSAAMAAIAKPHHLEHHLGHQLVAHPKITYSKQFHSQDGLGNYRYGYATDSSSKTETKSGDVVHGAYNYVDANGLLQTVEYTADKASGFIVKATNLPVAPEDTLEVKEARAKHQEAVEEAKKAAEAAIPAVELHPPQPYNYYPVYAKKWYSPEQLYHAVAKPFFYEVHSVHYDHPIKHAGDNYWPMYNYAPAMKYIHLAA